MLELVDWGTVATVVASALALFAALAAAVLALCALAVMAVWAIALATNVEVRRIRRKLKKEGNHGDD